MEDEVVNLKLYRRIENIGTGSYGDVSLYEHNNVLYAIKRVTMFNTISTMMEISMYNSLSHPYIVKPLEIVTLKKGIENIVMQVGLQPLHRAIDKKLSQELIILIMHLMLLALDYLHQNNVIHRDIKPDNILLYGASAQLIDFGLSTYMFQSTCKYPNIYTYHYRAPEIYAQLSYDTKADIFAMGATLYEMIYRRYMAPNVDSKIGRKGHQEMLLDILEAKDTISQDPKIDANLKHLLLSMIDEDPDKRLSAKELLHLPIFRSFSYSDPDIVLWRVIDPDDFPDARKPKHPILSQGATNYAARLSVQLHGSSLLKTNNQEQLLKIGMIITRIAYCVYDDNGYEPMYSLVELPDGTPNYDMMELIQKIFQQLKYNIIVL